MTNKKKNTKITKKTAIGLLVLGQIMTTGALAAPQEAISAFKEVKEWIAPKKVDTKNKISISIYTPSPSQMARAYY